MTGRHDESEVAWRPPVVTGGTGTGTPDFGPDPELAEAHLAGPEQAAPLEQAVDPAALYLPPTGGPDAPAAGTQPMTPRGPAQQAPAVAEEPNPNETQIVPNPARVNPGQPAQQQGQQPPAHQHQAPQQPVQPQVPPVQHQQARPPVQHQRPAQQPVPQQQPPQHHAQQQPMQQFPPPMQHFPGPVPQQGQQNPYAQNPAVTGPHQVGPGYGQPGHGEELSSARLLKQSKRAPQSGWRKAVYVATGRLINVGESPAEVRRRELIGRVNQPLRGCYKIAMLSLKGGVGKTTTTTTLGSTFSSLRGDRVIAVDANPDRGTLSQKIPLETTATVRHLLRDAGRIRRYSDIRAYTSQGPSRLEVLASEQDPAVSEAFSEDDYRRTVSLLEHFYNIVLTDCGTGLMHSAMKGVLDVADSLVIVSSGSVDGARSASATLDWLDAHGYRTLVARSVAVINSVRPKSGSVDLDKLAQHFGARCRAVCRIPFDPHLEEGAEIELERLAPETRLALLEMAATVADDFASGPRPRTA
ncbi:MinD/ParA family ATP-binding protein [Actinokineospora globicatena]|nr:AAA family ATPase [Actinokineospora globicatena]MCP2301704.1 MinD-like ATPase involved in chromosome partitioning or flagellar assembly [Actinokineospora globicatena]